MRYSLLALLLLSPLALAKGPDIDKVNGSIRTEATSEYGDLETVNGAVVVTEGVIAEKVSTVNGSISIADDAVVERAETVNGGIDIDRNVTIRGDVETVNGAIKLRRGTQVGGGVQTVNGGISLLGAKVERDLRTVSGSILVGEDSTVRGAVIVEKPNGMMNWWGKRNKPRVTIAANAVVEGGLHFEQEVELKIHPSAKVGNITGVAPVRLDGGNVER